jgi:hypothetical protein
MEKKSRSELEAECRLMFSEISPCYSVKKEHPEKWDWFMDLISLHPLFPENVIGFFDIRVCDEEMFLAHFEEDISFSWKMCCIQPKRYYRREAMRNAICDQIEEFRRYAPKVCPCGSDGPFHVDHVVFFADLCKQFEEGRDDIPPDVASAYGTSKWFNACFKGGKFAEDWKAYHRENAVLRILCKSCNLGREKPRRTKRV